MRVSDLEFTTEMLNDVWKGHSVDLPKTDARRMVSNPKAAADYIAEYGGVTNDRLYCNENRVL